MMYLNKLKFLAYAENIDERSKVVAELFCDTESDLPSANGIDGYTLCMGSIAYVIATGSLYVLGSDGVWYNSEGETPGAQIMPTTVEKFNIANTPMNDVGEEVENIDKFVGDVESF